MMWDQVLAIIVKVVQTDSAMKGIYGTNMRMSGNGKPETPSLEWTVLSDIGTQELWAPVLIQFDQWHDKLAKLVEGERRLRTLFDTALPAEFDGLRMWCSYLDGDMTATPDRNNFNGRAIRFRFTPLRSRYSLSSTSTS